MKSLIILATLTVAGLSYPGTASGGLAHRYSFNEGTAADSVGSADGTIVGNATISAGVLNTSSGGYVNLPSSATAGIDESFSIELWYTWFGGGGPQISYSFGLQGNGYLLSHPSWNGGHTVEYSPGGLLGGSLIGSAAQNTLLHLVTTYDHASGLRTMYVNGNLKDSRTAGTFDLATLGALRADVGGRGAFNDPSLNGTIDEFRIWDSVLSSEEVAEAFAAGPEVVIPEPASLALLGLGGLALLRRTTN